MCVCREREREGGREREGVRERVCVERERDREGERECVCADTNDVCVYDESLQR